VASQDDDGDVSGAKPALSLEFFKQFWSDSLNKLDFSHF
jgi:hypothetical protein